MHAMYDMHDPNRSSLEKSYARSSKCENEMFSQQLAYLSLEYSKVDTSGIEASDTVPLIDNQWEDEVHCLMTLIWMNFCLLLVVHFFCPQNSSLDSCIPMFIFSP